MIRFNRILFGAVLAFASFPLFAASGIRISEIMYHPVEEAQFNPDGTPALDLWEDVHEFVELYNASAAAVSMGGWELSGAVHYIFPAGAIMGPGQYWVVAKDPAQLLAIAEYALSKGIVFGPWTGTLGNSGETIRLKNPSQEVVDTVTYSSKFPWAISANGLGASENWTGVKERDHQYRGRSLERVSYEAPSDDPANWVASPIPGEPSPGRPNHLRRVQPEPVVVQLRVSQANNGQRIIRKNQAVRVECIFSSTTQLRAVQVEYFLDNIQETNEARNLTMMQVVGNAGRGQFRAELPGQADRSIVRFRIRADRGEGDGVVSPRADDPYLWYAYFVTPARSSVNPSYDLFISASGLRTLSTNINQNPRRVVLPDPPGKPRASWNATEPAVFVYDGVVYDVQMRYHGSRYRRSTARQSYKLEFPRYALFDNHGSVFVTDKDYQTEAGHAIFRAAGLPTSLTRWVDLYLNTNPKLVRLQQEEYDDHLLERYGREQSLLHPDEPQQEVGQFYKCVGFDGTAEGPYGNGNGKLLPARAPFWTALQRYEWTYALQDHGWLGHTQLQQMMEALWAARGSSTINTNALRAYYPKYWDIDRELTYLSVINWMVPWDDVFQNYFLWQQRDGRWSQLPWDFDSVMNGQSATASIFNGVPNQQPANYFKTSFIAVFREEFKARAWFLNNTVLHPDNVAALGVSSQIRTWSTNRWKSVNTQLGLGTFERPIKPANQFPGNGQRVGPSFVFKASAYGYSTNPAAAHASSTWLVRPANGSYYAPVLQARSTNELTSLAVAPGVLQVGQSYYWKCIYTDALGHPSLASAETSFTVGAGANLGVDVVFNEVMARNEKAVANGGKFPDWIELYNPGLQPKRIDNLAVTDDLTVPAKFRFPAGTTIAGRGFLVVWCDRAFQAPGLHTGFGLNGEGQTLSLLAQTADGWALQDVVTYGPQLPDLSIGRISDGKGDWALNMATPAKANKAHAITSANAVKINEWMANPASGSDWIELYNPSSGPAALGGLSLSDDLDVPAKSVLAPLTFIGEGGFLRLWADNKPERGGGHLAFRLGTQAGVLGFFNANGTVLDTVFYGAQAQGISEGRVPDGGPSIYHLIRNGTPGTSNAVDSNADGLPDGWELANGMDPWGASNAALDPDHDGLSNLEEYRAGTNPRMPESRLKIEKGWTGNDGGGFQVQFVAEPGIAYAVEFRDQLNGWQTLEILSALDTQRMVAVRDSRPVTAPWRYYRVRALPVE